MDFTLNEDQELLKESVDRFVREAYTFDRRQALVASELGFSREHWKQFAELGWLALGFAEEHGGLGGSALDSAVLMEAFGRALLVEPYFTTVVLGGKVLEATGAHDLIPSIVEGELLIALAHSEPESRFDLTAVETRAEPAGSGFRLHGRKSFVLHAATADKLIVSARAGDEGVSLFLVDRESEGVSLRGYATVDGLRAADIALEDVHVEEQALLGERGGALAAIEPVIDRAITLLAAEAVGAMGALNKSTFDYLKTRHQFGVPIGSFQALQHRAVDMFVDYELSRALAYRAAAAIENLEGRERARAASAAKVQIGRAGKRIGQEAIQLHGGMGMTNELAIGHYFKRLSMIDVLFGNVDHHLERLATLSL